MGFEIYGTKYMYAICNVSTIFVQGHIPPKISRYYHNIGPKVIATTKSVHCKCKTNIILCQKDKKIIAALISKVMGRLKEYNSTREIYFFDVISDYHQVKWSKPCIMHELKTLATLPIVFLMLSNEHERYRQHIKSFSALPEHNYCRSKAVA